MEATFCHTPELAHGAGTAQVVFDKGFVVAEPNASMFNE